MKALLLAALTLPLRAEAQRHATCPGMAGSTGPRGSVVYLWRERNDTTWLTGAVVFRDSTPDGVVGDSAGKAATQRVQDAQTAAFKAGRGMAGGFRGPHSDIARCVLATGVIEVDSMSFTLPQDSTTILLFDRDANRAQPVRMSIAQTWWALPPLNPDTAAHAERIARSRLEFDHWRAALRADPRAARLLSSVFAP